MPPPQTMPPPYPPQPHGYPPYQAPVGVVAAKSPGLAVFLSIWLGGGHLYIGKIGPGIALLCLHFFLLLLLFTLVGAFFAIPIWMISFACVAYNAHNGALEFNRRNGIFVR